MAVPREVLAAVQRVLAEMVVALPRMYGARPSPHAIAALEALDVAVRAADRESVAHAAADPAAWLSVAQAAEQRGCTPQLIRKMARDGKLPARRVGREWLVSLGKPDRPAA